MARHRNYERSGEMMDLWKDYFRDPSLWHNHGRFKVGLSLVFLYVYIYIYTCTERERERERWAISLHGGAGMIPCDFVAPVMNQKIEDSLHNCF